MEEITNREVEYWMRKVKWILRDHFRKQLSLQAVEVKLPGFEPFYDVYIFHWNDPIYSDCLDKDELNRLLRAINIICDIEGESIMLDGLVIRFSLPEEEEVME